MFRKVYVAKLVKNITRGSKSVEGGPYLPGVQIPGGGVLRYIIDGDVRMRRNC